MAATETILICSSSPQAPPSPNQVARPMHSSSPGLPSPSALFRTNGPLRSGSRLAQVPKGATIGFATAASVWHKEQQETLEIYSAEDNVVDHIGPCESTESVRAPSKGKLVRPKKSTDKAHTRFAQNDPIPEQDSTTISVGQETNTSRENEFSNVQGARRKSVELSGQGYTRGPSDQAEQGDIILQRKPAKSRRNTKVQGETQPKVKQSRTKNTTSDDAPLVTAEVVEVVPESDRVSTEVHEAEPTGEATASKPKKPRARAIKSDKPVKPRKGKASKASATNEQVLDPHAHPVLEKAANNEAHNESIESVEGQQKSVVDTALPEIGDYLPDLAPRRRLSWTPVQDTAIPPSFQQSEIETIESPPKTTATFGDLLGNFAYHQAEEAQRPPSQDRDVNGEAFTKRRRLDPVGGVDVSKEAEEKPKAKGRARAKKPPKESVPKKAKSPKKKATTITELATSAYRPVQLESPSANPTISDFFAPQDQTAEQRESEMRTMVRLAKPKPVRKRPSRAKVAFAEGSEDNASKSTKSKAKGKSATSSSAVESQILYTPQKAQRDMRSQDFLFGTSSQLARDESPTFIRDMQLAMKESENLMSSQIADSGEATSAAPVPTAPHGTSLTVGQAHRALWSVSARDFDRATLVPDEDLFPPDNLESRGGNAKVEQPSHEEDPGTSSFMEVQDTEGRAAEPTAMEPTPKPHVQVRHEPSNSKDTENPDSGFVDIDQIPSSVTKDTWAIIADEDSKDLSAAAPDSASATTHQLPRPIASPRRAALQPLDANIPVLQAAEKDPKLAVSASRLIPTTVLDISHPTVNPASISEPQRKGRGRPRKVSLTIEPPGVETASIPVPVPQKKPRGRPRKDTGPLPTVPSPKPRGRAPKLQPLSEAPSLATTAAPASPKPRGRPHKTAASGPVTAPATPKRKKKRAEVVSVGEERDWHMIDEIQDSEAELTPSPPRRKSSSPLVQQPLELSPSHPVPGPSTNPTLPALPAFPLSTLPKLKTSKPSKADEAAWAASIFPTLFPQITRTVKSAPRTADLATPSWYEKMLLYDPVVIEDLTAWLNGAGVRVEVVREVGEGKGKKRKGAKAKAAGKGGAEGGIGGGEEDGEGDVRLEVVRQELSPWIVQRWCEENSVCCLWKEGMRGGVKNKY